MRTSLLLATLAISTLAAAQPPAICDELQAGFSYAAATNGTQFTNTTASTNFQTNWSWTFGDGGTSDNIAPLHHFAQPGTYEVCLVVTGIYELVGAWVTCTDEVCHEVVVGSNTGICDQLVAGFTTTNTANGTYFINATTGAGTQTTYAWTFGDGGTSDAPSAFHHYAEPGTYEACLTVVSVYGVAGGVITTCTDVICHDVVIEGSDPCSDLVACFETSAIDNNSFQFTSCTQPASNVQYVWHFGDNTNGSGPNPDHSYAEPGTYTVCMVAYWNTCTEEICHDVVVEGTANPCESLVPGFSWSTSISGTQFTNTTTGLGFDTSWSWNFGDQTTGDGEAPLHLYAGPGTYHVCLIVVTHFEVNGAAVACTHYICHDVVIEGNADICDQLVAGFTTTSSANGIYFLNATTGLGFQTAYSWTFGDGGTSDAMPTFHHYAEPGIYNVCLVVVSMYETAIGGGVITCTDEYCHEVAVTAAGTCDDLVACFETTAIDNNSFQFTSCTQPATNVQYVWHFGDGNDGSGPNPDHSYAEPGTYTVCMVAYWNTCTEEICHEVVVEGTANPCESLAPGFSWTTSASGTQFNNTTTGLGFDTSWSWNFGDQTTGDGEAPLHFYAGPGTYHVCLIVVTHFETSAGVPLACTSYICHDVVIEGNADICDQLLAGFTTTSSANGIYFLNATTGLGFQTAYSWTFGDGGTSDAMPAFHHYAEPGIYNVCLVVVSMYETAIGGGVITCTDEYCHEVAVTAAGTCDDLVACFETTAIDNNSFQFTSCTQPATNVQYVWHFGDGNDGSGPNPDHSYAEPGTYTVCMVAYWNGCTEEICHEVVVEGTANPCESLAPGFSWTTTSSGTQFNNTTTGLGYDTSWNWAFGDQTNGDGGAPLHLYAGPGTYHVCLIVVTHFEVNGAATACTAYICHDVVIESNADICDQLVAGFTTTSSANGIYFLNATTGTGFQTTYAWTFGDGGTSDAMPTFHHYAEPGVYNVCLVVVSMYETVGGNVVTCTDEYCHEVVVEGNADICDQLEAYFTWATVTNGIQFTNTTAGLGFETTWSWTFGDGGISDDQAPLHHYAEPGTYEVCLVVTTHFETPAGVVTCTDEYCTNVVVQGGGDICNGLEAYFTWATVTNGIQFTNTTAGLGSGTTWSWTFGDGGTSDGSAPFHHYAEPGTYEVCLVATTHFETTAGVVICTDEYCTNVVVQGGGDICDQLQAGFTWAATAPGIQFTNTTAGLGFETTWHWTFGDGGTSDDGSPFHHYAEPGTYNVCLVVITHYETSAGVVACTDEFCHEIVVQGSGDICNELAAHFTWTTAPDGTQFTNTSVGLGFGTTWSWTLGDGGTSDAAAPLHHYAEPGDYEVCLVVTTYFETPAGIITCIDEFCTVVVINGTGCESFEVDFAWTAQGTGVLFEASTSIPVAGYHWFFGDGTTGDGNPTDHLYEPPGPYHVCLAAWYWTSNNQQQCWAEHCEDINPFSVGIEEPVGSGVNVFPVPANDYLVIAGLHSSADLRMFAADGRLVLQERASGDRYQVDVSRLARGSYTLEIRTGEERSMRRVIIE